MYVSAYSKMNHPKYAKAMNTTSKSEIVMSMSEMDGSSPRTLVSAVASINIAIMNKIMLIMLI